jgi:glycosyltransferase involved in cell wall biosynthesis
MAPAPRVSVVIPAYHERFFGEALASVLAQEGVGFEVLVCDDSPGAAIGAVVTGLRDARVRYVRNASRRGFEGNFTYGFSMARGDLVKFLNDDDRLRPGCLARLAAAFDANPGLALATSRRIVIDAAGAPRPDLPATTPLAHVSCEIEGTELGDFTLINGLNFIGEPSTVMFARSRLPGLDGGLFTWNGRAYHCLADWSLWLRLLARGPAFYSATPLSEYRVHPGQEQRDMAVQMACITERLPLVREARAAGFLKADVQYRAALARVRSLAEQWRARPGSSPEAVSMLAAFLEELARA